MCAVCVYTLMHPSVRLSASACVCVQGGREVTCDFRFALYSLSEGRTTFQYKFYENRINYTFYILESMRVCVSCLIRVAVIFR